MLPQGSEEHMNPESDRQNLPRRPKSLFRRRYDHTWQGGYGKQLLAI